MFLVCIGIFDKIKIEFYTFTITAFWAKGIS